MSILDQITQMKSQGRSAHEIIEYLQEQGIPPKEIQDAMSQAQIKNAISKSQVEGMEQSIMDQNPYEEEGQDTMEAAAQPPTYDPQMQESYQEYAPQYPQQDYSQGYPPEQGYAYTQGADTGTLVEIAEQVFNDKARKIQKQIESLNEFKVLSEIRLKNMEERLKRIEEMFDKLQLSILDKVGSYGKNLSSMQKEMDMMQDSFGKIAGSVLDKRRR